MSPAQIFSDLMERKPELELTDTSRLRAYVERTIAAYEGEAPDYTCGWVKIVAESLGCPLAAINPSLPSLVSGMVTDHFAPADKKRKAAAPLGPVRRARVLLRRDAAPGEQLTSPCPKRLKPVALMEPAPATKSKEAKRAEIAEVDEEARASVAKEIKEIVEAIGSRVVDAPQVTGKLQIDKSAHNGKVIAHITVTNTQGKAVVFSSSPQDAPTTMEELLNSILSKRKRGGGRDGQPKLSRRRTEVPAPLPPPLEVAPPREVPPPQASQASQAPLLPPPREVPAPLPPPLEVPAPLPPPLEVEVPPPLSQASQAPPPMSVQQPNMGGGTQYVLAGGINNMGFNNGGGQMVGVPTGMPNNHFGGWQLAAPFAVSHNNNGPQIMHVHGTPLLMQGPSVWQPQPPMFFRLW